MPYFEDLFIKEAKKALEYHSDRGGGTVSGRNACHVVQDTPPEDPNVLWVDTTDNSDDGFQGGGIAVTGATVGQTVKISAVDESGKPTKWDSVDFPSDEHINSLINTALGVIENGTY